MWGAAFAGVRHALAVLASTGALQTAVLDAIADRLDALYALLLDETSIIVRGPSSTPFTGSSPKASGRYVRGR
nr:hypothetical protein [Frankia gtarii]